MPLVRILKRSESSFNHSERQMSYRSRISNVSFYSDGHHGGHGHHGESQQIERLRELVKAGNVSIGEIFALLRKGEIGVHLSHPTTTPGETLFFLLRIAL